MFLPWAVPTFLSGLTWAWLFNPVIGPLPHWLAALGILAEPYNILGDPGIAMWGPIVANVWFGVPFFAITLLAALQAIPRSLYEAAAIDGAGAWQAFARVTLPFLAPIIAITVLLRTIWISNFADLIVVMTNGGPANATQILPSYIFTTAYKKLDFGYASAIATVLLALLLLYAADPDPHAPRSTGHTMSAPAHERRAQEPRQERCADRRPSRRDRRLHAVRAVPAVLADQDRGHARPAAVQRGHPRSGPRARRSPTSPSSCCRATSRPSSRTR